MGVVCIAVEKQREKPKTFVSHEVLPHAERQLHARKFILDHKGESIDAAI